MLPNGLIYFYPSSHHLFPHESKVDFSELFPGVFRQRRRFEAKARPDTRSRIRGRVIRIRIRKTGIRAVIRITAEQDTARATNLYTLLQIVPRSRCPHRYPSREFVHFPNLGEDIFDFPRIGEELACIAVVIVPIHLDLDERPILSELRFHSLDVVADPKGEVYQLLLRRFGAVKMLVGFVGGDFQEIQRTVIFHRIMVILHCRIV